MRSLDFRSDAKRKRVTAAYCTEAKEIEFSRDKIGAGKAAKIDFVRIGVLAPFVVDSIQVDNFGFQTVRFQHCGKAQDADGGKLSHDASCIRLAHRRVAQLVGRGRADEADFHRRHLRGAVRSGSDGYYREEALRGPVRLARRTLAAHIGDQSILEGSA